MAARPKERDAMFTKMSSFWHANQRELFKIAGTLVWTMSLAFGE